MKRLATVLVIAGAFLGATVSSASAGSSSSTSNSSVAGIGKVAFAGNVGYANFLFAATKKGSTTKGFFTQVTPSGQSIPAGSWTGDVKCLSVSGNTAVLAGVLTKKTGSFASNPSTGFEVALKGNSNGSAGMSSGTFTPYPGLLAPAVCDPFATFTALFPLGPVASGYILVGNRSFGDH
jgi:hypothetical protein